MKINITACISAAAIATAVLGTGGAFLLSEEETSPEATTTASWHDDGYLVFFSKTSLDEAFSTVNWDDIGEFVSEERYDIVVNMADQTIKTTSLRQGDGPERFSVVEVESPDGSKNVTNFDGGITIAETSPDSEIGQHLQAILDQRSNQYTELGV